MKTRPVAAIPVSVCRDRLLQVMHKNEPVLYASLARPVSRGRWIRSSNVIRLTIDISVDRYLEATK
jgi:hypothetical protein